MSNWLDVSTDRAIKRLDIERAKRAGEVFVTHAAEAGEIPNLPLVDVAAQNPKELVAAYDEFRSRYATAPFDPEGHRIRFYPRGVTIWSGYPGAGKTTLLRQLACHFLAHNQNVFFASLEEHPGDLLVRLASTASACEHARAEQLEWFCDWFGSRIKIWGVVGTAKHRQIFSAIRDTKCTHAIIDSLMCLDISNSDNEAQRKFGNELVATARMTGAHVHIVAHPRKLVSAEQELDINDVAGARELVGIVDNVLFVRRSKKESFGDEQLGMAVAIKKQRHGDFVGDVKGWYQRKWRQFSIDQFPIEPVHYLPHEAYL